MSLLRKVLIGAALALAAMVAVLVWHIWPAFSPPENIDVGTAVGESVPINQPLRDANGNDISLADVSGENGTVLVMVRSADWCPFCILQLEEHALIGAELEERGYTLASLSYDEPEKLADFLTWVDRPFVMLSDTESQFIDAVGLRDPQYPEDHYAFGVPRASVLVLAPDGTIRDKLVSADYRQRPNNDFLLRMVDGLEN